MGLTGGTVVEVSEWPARNGWKLRQPRRNQTPPLQHPPKPPTKSVQNARRYLTRRHNQVRGLPRLPHQSTFKFVEYHACHSNRHSSSWSTTPATPIAIQVRGVPRLPHQSTFKFVEYHAYHTNRLKSLWRITPATPIDIQVRGVPRLPHQSTFKLVEYRACHTNRCIVFRGFLGFTVLGLRVFRV